MLGTGNFPDFFWEKSSFQEMAFGKADVSNITIFSSNGDFSVKIAGQRLRYSKHLNTKNLKSEHSTFQTLFGSGFQMA